MEAADTARILVVAQKTAATPALLDAVRQRAQAGPAWFYLLVPGPPASWHRHDAAHPKVSDSEQALALALPLITEAAGGHADGAVSRRHDPMDAIEEALHDQGYDEIILSTLPRTVSRWLHVDLPSRVSHLGLPVTTVIAQEHAAAKA